MILSFNSSVHEETTKVDLEAANRHRVDVELRREVVTSVLICLLLAA